MPSTALAPALPPCQSPGTCCYRCHSHADYRYSDGRRICHDCLSDDLAVLQLQAYAARRKNQAALQELAA